MIKDKLSLVTNKPGCYLMKNSEGIIIYVGKAKNLKKRLSSYFRGIHSGKTAKLISEITDFEYMVVSSETESLILELNLIKKYEPKYNILLRDDKSYPYIELTNDEVPRLLIVRNINLKKNKQHLYGPYPNVTAARYTVNLLNRLYPLRKCNTYDKKPCLYFHIKECLGYCSHNVDKNLINTMKEDITKFLKGDSSKVIEKISSEMLKSSANLEYEKAKELKDLLDYINITLEKQKVEINDNIDRDIFGYFVDKGYLSIQVFFIRGGKIVGRHSKITPLIDETEEELTKYIASFYEKDVILPKEILVPNLVDYKLLSSFFKVSVKAPIKGVKNNLIKMVNDNAYIALKEQFELIKKDEEKTIEANVELKNILNLTKLDRIEVFDNSNLFGSFNVSGMVVFVDGSPKKDEYRKFKIMLNKNDDYNAMREVIYRRYFRVLKDNLVKPDLIIVDGGIGQINVARSIISDLNLNIPVVGLKKDNKHLTTSLLGFDPIVSIPINKRSNLFYYLERIQDEVHNFTVNYHRNIRSKGTLESIIDNAYGLGPIRKKQLLKKYKTITKLKEASNKELEELIPSNVAIKLKNLLDNME